MLGGLDSALSFYLLIFFFGVRFRVEGSTGARPDSVHRQYLKPACGSQFSVILDFSVLNMASHYVIMYTATAGANGPLLGTDEEDIVLMQFLVWDAVCRKVVVP